MFSITFLTRSISIIVQTVSPIVLVKILGTPATMIGWMIAGFWIANAVGTIIAAGAIRNRRSSLLVGLAVLALAFFGAALIHDSLGYAACIILSGLGLSVVQAFLIPTMHASSRNERPHIGIANYSTALSLGMIAGPLAAAAAIYVYGFSTLFVILALISVAVFVVVERIGIQKSFAQEDTRTSILPSNIFKVLRQRVFANYYVLNFLYSMLLPILISYGGIYAESRFKISSSEVLTLFAAVFAVSTMMRILFTRSEQRHFRLLLVVGFASLFASFTIIGSAGSFSLFLVGFILFSIPHALIYPITTFMALESGGKESVLSSTYIFATSSGIAEFISPLAAVPIIALYNFSWVFLAMAPISLVALFLSAILTTQKTR
jgi:predicted MFS family arabinose efflux permease